MAHEFSEDEFTEVMQKRIPPMLSLIAGMVDVTGYLSLKLFTAHVTGNIVIIAAHLVNGGPPNMDQILAVPIFILAVIVAWLSAQALKRQGPALARLLLFLQLLLLCGALIVAVIYHPSAEPRGLMADFTSALAISAMACQYSLLQLTLRGAPSTAVMTGNLTKTVLAFLESVTRRKPLMKNSKEELKKAMRVLIGFFVGCLIGAGAVAKFGDWAWAFPAATAAITIALVPRTHSNRNHG